MGAHRLRPRPMKQQTPIQPERRKNWRTQNCRRCCRCRRPEPPPMTAADFCVTTDGTVSRFRASDFSALTLQKRGQRQGHISRPKRKISRWLDGPMDQLGLGMLGCIFAHGSIQKNRVIKTPSPNRSQTHQDLCCCRYCLCAFGVGLGKGIQAGAGWCRWRWPLGAGVCPMGGQVGRRRAGLGALWLPCSVPGRVAHGVGIRGAQVGRFRDDNQGEKVFGDVIPIEGTLHGSGNAIEICHGFFLC